MFKRTLQVERDGPIVEPGALLMSALMTTSDEAREALGAVRAPVVEVGPRRRVRGLLAVLGRRSADDDDLAATVTNVWTMVHADPSAPAPTAPKRAQQDEEAAPRTTKRSDMQSAKQAGG